MRQSANAPYTHIAVEVSTGEEYREIACFRIPDSEIDPKERVALMRYASFKDEHLAVHARLHWEEVEEYLKEAKCLEEYEKVLTPSVRNKWKRFALESYSDCTCGGDIDPEASHSYWISARYKEFKEE